MRKRKAAGIITIILIWTGSAAAQQMSAYSYNQRMTAFWQYATPILLECKAQKDRGQIRSFVEQVRCANHQLAEAWSWYKLDFGDLVSLFLAKRLEVAERRDRGGLTEGQAQVELAQAYSQLVGTAQQRLANAAAFQAQSQAVAAQQRAQQQAARSEAITNSLSAAAAIFGSQRYWVPQFPASSPQAQHFNCSVNRSPSLSGPSLSCSN